MVGSAQFVFIYLLTRHFGTVLNFELLSVLLRRCRNRSGKWTSQDAGAEFG